MPPLRGHHQLSAITHPRGALACLGRLTGLACAGNIVDLGVTEMIARHKFNN
jgi:hypothetical protein